MIVPLLAGTTIALAQKSKVRKPSTSVVGEYRDQTKLGSLTFNIERNKRTRKYHLWIGNMGTSSMNYHDADATDLQIDNSNGALAFSYTDDDGRCSFSGTVKGGKITGELACMQNGHQESKRVVLKAFR